MAEVIRTEIRGHDITIDGQPTRVGQVDEFSNHKTLQQRYLSPRLTLSPSFDNNAVHVESVDKPSSVFYPKGKRVSASWETEIGDRPGKKPIQQEFGYPNPVVIVEFLGHPNRDVLVPYMEKQEQAYQPTRVELYKKTDETNGTIVSSGEIITTNIYGLSDQSRRSELRQKPKDGFSGKLMIGSTIESVQNGLHLDIDVFGATIADADNLVRIKTNHPADVRSFQQKNLSSVLQALAEFNLFSRQLSSNKKQWIPDGFPMMLLAYINMDLLNKVRGLDTRERDWDSLKKNFGIDWQKIRQSFRPKDVTIERQRLINEVDQLLKRK